MTLASTLNILPGNTAVTNRTNLQNAINAGDLCVQFDSAGTYLFDQTVVIDNTNACRLDGMGIAVLYMDDSATLGGGLFEWWNSTGDHGPKMHQKIYNFKQLKSAGSKVLGTRKYNGTYRPAFLHLCIEKTRFLAPNNGWCVDFDVDFSIGTVFRDCHFEDDPTNGGAGIKMTGVTPNTNVPEYCNCTFLFHTNKTGPALWINENKMPHIRNLIFQGEWGFKNGVDYSSWLGANCIFYNGPGPATAVFMGIKTDELTGSKASDQEKIVVQNPYTGNSAGFMSPGVTHLIGAEAASIVIQNKNNCDPMLLNIECASDGKVFDPAKILNAVGNNLNHVYCHHGMVTPGYDGAAALTADSHVTLHDLHQTGTDVIQGLYRTPLVVLYRYPGGTGNDGSLTLQSFNRGTLYPHRHPVYGACMAIYTSDSRGPNGVVYKRVQVGVDTPDLSQKRVYCTYQACAPHYYRQTSSSSASAQFGLIGGSPEIRSIPDGFAPACLQYSLPITDATNLFDLNNMPGVTGDTWYLFYGATACCGGYWLADQVGCKPAEFWMPSSTPPAGTYMVGDVGRVVNSTTVKTCTVAGTSRTISLTGNVTNGSPTVTNISSITKLLEGDYVAIGGATYLVKTIDASNPTITLGSNYAGATATGVAVVNSNPTWV